MPEFTFDLFLSHNSKDKKQVVELNLLLAEQGLSGWLDKDQLPPGQNWQPLIESGLKNSKAIAACFGGAGVGPWQDEEMQAAMNLAVKEKRPVIPVLLPGAKSQPALPLFLQNRGWVDFRNGFSGDAINELIWGITLTKPGTLGSTRLQDLPPPPVDPAEYERRIQEIFGPQYDQLKTILEKHPALRDALASRYAAAGMAAQQMTAHLIASFHHDFLQAIGNFAQIYDDGEIEGTALLELVSSIIFLSMCPSYASTLRRESGLTKIEVSPDASQGIADMLLSWIKFRGGKPVSVKHLSQEKSPEIFETSPQMTMTSIKHSLMDRLGIKRDAIDAETQLELKLQNRKLFGHPEFQAVAVATDADRRLILEIEAPDSPLRFLLLLIKIQGQTIHPSREAQEPLYDRRLELNLRALIDQLSKS